MRLILIVVALAALPLLLPAASAHDCNGYDCGRCESGQYHNHNSARGQCSSGPGWYAENGYNGQRASWSGGSASNGHDGQRYSPGTATLGTLLALVGAAGILAMVGRRA
jgi:hypothetical protein